MQETQKTKINPQFRVEKFDGEVLLYDQSAGQAIYLNDTAHAVFQLCQEGMTIGQMIEYLEDAYPDQGEQIRVDLFFALGSLQEKSVIEIIDA